MNYQYIATVAQGLEKVAAKELISLGAENVTTEFTCVHFSGDKKLLYKVNLWSRTIFRVLKPIEKVKCFNKRELYQNLKKIDWSNYLLPEDSFAVNCTGGNQQLNHTHFTALEVKNAIVDQQREQYNKRSNIDTENPDILLNAHIYQNHCILSLDSSGNSLHRRGYRPAMGLAPLKESLAAALLDLAEWTPDLPFFDPLCGSGTLPIEAALKALNIAPGLYRENFGFQTWPDYDKKLWNELVKEAENSQELELLAPIIGSDSNSEVIKQANLNARNSGVRNHVKLLQKTLAEVEAPSDSGVIICNPPYGKRIGELDENEALYKLLGDVFKQRFKGWTAYILTGNKELAKKVGLRAAKRIPVNNGAIPCTLLKYELY
jgi:putative N6-adenine-specific DNA methylase